MTRRELLAALLDQPNYRRLYQEHVGFHLAVDGLVGMLPGLIAGMAAQALEDEGRRLEAVQRLMDQPLDISWAVGMSEIPEPQPPETPLAIDPQETPTPAIAIERPKPTRKPAVKKVAKAKKATRTRTRR